MHHYRRCCRFVQHHAFVLVEIGIARHIGPKVVDGDCAGVQVVEEPFGKRAAHFVNGKVTGLAVAGDGRRGIIAFGGGGCRWSDII